MASDNSFSSEGHLKELIEVEKEARQKIARAEKEAETIKREAQQWARSHLDETKRQALLLKERLIEEVDNEIKTDEATLSDEISGCIRKMNAAYQQRKEKLLDAFYRSTVKEWDLARLEEELYGQENGGNDNPAGEETKR